MAHKAYRRKTLYEQMDTFLQRKFEVGQGMREETFIRFFCDVLKQSKEQVIKTLCELEAGERVITDRGWIYPARRGK